MMKRIFITIAFNITVMASFAQISKGSVQLSIEGYYMKTPMEFGVKTNQFAQLTKQGTIGVMGEYFLSDKLSLGIGIKYQSQKDERYNSVYILSSVVQNERLESEQSAWLPVLAVSYYQPLINKLYLSCSTSFTFGTINAESESFVVSATPMPMPEFAITEDNRSVFSYVEKDDHRFTGFKIAPRIHYFATGYLGFYLGLGGADYTMIDGDTDNSSLQLDFAPKNWSFGVNLTF